MKLAAKLIAIYFPQFHRIVENDQWWGEGFTDWDSVRKARPLFAGHSQPRVPLNGNYYDQSDIATLQWQVELAKKYNIYGFCFYHYWFDGRTLLETPLHLMLEHQEIDFPFCLSWANETWSRRWDGRDREVLIDQTHPVSEKSWLNHFKYLVRFWRDERAIKVDGKPVFVIYRPHRIPRIAEMVDFWRRKAEEHGLKGIYLIAQRQHEYPGTEWVRCFDAEFQFQPFEAVDSPTFRGRSVWHARGIRMLRRLPERFQDLLRGMRTRHIQGPTLYDYDMVWEQIVAIREHKHLTTFPGAFADWDNTPRYRQRATIFLGANPRRFEYWFYRLLASMEHRNLPEKFIFFNAWNEWAEGAYLEPDERYGHAYLETISRALSRGENGGA